MEESNSGKWGFNMHKYHTLEPKLSIIIPVYNTEAYFERCINSILGQSYKNLEIVVVNDGSAGNISEIIEVFREDPRILFIDNKVNNGLLRARVLGLQHASGEYIAFVDSDDYVSFDYYRCLVERAVSSEADIVIGSTVWDDKGEKYIYNYHASALSFSELNEDNVKERFFGQEYYCYSWHTVWNKVYNKKLIDSCMDEFLSVKEHVVMTEDLYFSSILFFNADKIARVENNAYFYCFNDDASTNSNQITFPQYVKKIKDIQYVFERVENYLQSQTASAWILQCLRRGRAHYARMWSNLAKNTFSATELDRIRNDFPEFYEDSVDNSIKDDYYFESIRTKWNGGFEYIKEQIRDSHQEYISFDIFDTLVSRPFYYPEDLFALLDSDFHKISSNTVLFSKIRSDGETLAREYYFKQRAVSDITLDEIYDFIIMHYGIDKSIAYKIKSKECEYELLYSQPRMAGLDLFNLAKSLNKKIILITDMYLGRDIIEKILEKCFIRGYSKLYISCEERLLKKDGHLFTRCLIDLGKRPADLLHIGDSWTSDVEGSRSSGISSIFFPKAREIYENRIKNCPTNQCSDIDKEVCEGIMNYEKINDNLGIRCMKALAVNKYFDNPYRTFHGESDFNTDPYFIGYYILGMHILGLTKWIHDYVRDKPVESIVFLARDGYLPYLACKKYGNAFGLDLSYEYMQASRKALLPYIAQHKDNFYQLPVEFKAHSPSSMMEMLQFASEGSDDKDFLELCKANGLDPETRFSDIGQYNQFISLFLSNKYSKEKHDSSKKTVSGYYRRIPDNSIVFDLGYSGRIQEAICRAAGKSINALFLHQDYDLSVRMKEYGGFEISSFYNYRPAVSGLIREYYYSEPSATCDGFILKDSEIIPVKGSVSFPYPNTFVVDTLHRASLEFLEDFLTMFIRHPAVFDFSVIETSALFEGFLKKPSLIDLHILSSSFSEDFIYGGSDRINLESFALEHISVSKDRQMADQMPNANIADLKSDEEKRILNLINTNSQFKRAIIWLLLDRRFFIEKFRININRMKTFIGAVLRRR